MRSVGAVLTFVAALSAIILDASAALAQTAANVAVVINERSPASIRIGEHYVRQRSIPPENVVRVDIAPVNAMSRASYSTELESPIARAFTRERLQDRILFIVLTKGIPLRIIGTTGLSGTTASVDSELTLLYRRMTGRPVPPQGPVENPFFAGERNDAAGGHFSRKDHDIYMVTRLDAFTVEDAMMLVDRSLAPQPTGAIVLDQRVHARSAIADRWMAEAADAVRSASVGRLVVLEESAAAAAGTGPAFGYFSWGSTDPALRGRPIEVPFVAGSIAATLGSAEAATFDPVPDATKPMTGDLIRAGASGAAGYVAEPYLQSSIRPQILFPAYLAGLTLGEAFYRALPHLSWQSVIIGDPLTRPFGKAPPVPVETQMDPATSVPADFSARRQEMLRVEFPGVAPAALQHLIASETHQARDDRSGAIAALVRATELAPAFAPLRLRLAVLQQEAGDAAKAMEGYRRVLELQPRNVVALNNLAFMVATTKGDALDEAMELARKAYALSPDDGTIVDTLGWIEHLRGNNQEATKLMRQAVQRAPNQIEVRLHAARVLADAGAMVEARTHLDAALKLDPKIEGRDDVKPLLDRLRK